MPCLVWLPDPDGNAFWGGACTYLRGELWAHRSSMVRWCSRPASSSSSSGHRFVGTSSMSDLARRARTASGSRPYALSRR